MRACVSALFGRVGRWWLNAPSLPSCPGGGLCPGGSGPQPHSAPRWRRASFPAGAAAHTHTRDFCALCPRRVRSAPGWGQRHGGARGGLTPEAAVGKPLLLQIRTTLFRIRPFVWLRVRKLLSCLRSRLPDHLAPSGSQILRRGKGCDQDFFTPRGHSHASLRGGYCYCPPLADEETEAQRDERMEDGRAYEWMDGRKVGVPPKRGLSAVSHRFARKSQVGREAGGWGGTQLAVMGTDPPGAGSRPLCAWSR